MHRSHQHPSPPLLSTRPPAPPGLRLQLDPTMAGTGAVDGGWWPRSRDPDAELPGLIAGLESSLGPITRVALNLDAWDTAPRRVAVDGRRVRVGWFHHMDAHTIGVTRASQDRVACWWSRRRQPRQRRRSRWRWQPTRPTAPGRPTSWQPPALARGPAPMPPAALP
jgi:hypothetical protein